MHAFTKGTMPKFTKGTWSYIDVSTPYERNFIIGTTTPDGLLFPHGSARKEADARLFAAAPDMYNFVRCVYEMSKTLDEEDDDYFIHEAAKKILDRIHGSEDHAHDEHA